MQPKTRHKILASPEWKWWEETLNYCPDAKDRKMYRKKFLYIMQNMTDYEIKYWQEQAAKLRNSWVRDD